MHDEQSTFWPDIQTFKGDILSRMPSNSVYKINVRECAIIHNGTFYDNILNKTLEIRDEYE